MSPNTDLRRKPRSLALDVVERLTANIRSGQLAAGHKLPTEAELMAGLGVSRTVVREAISRLQAAALVETRHGVGTFVLANNDSPPFKVSPEQLGTLREVIALLELRIGLETEAAALAARGAKMDSASSGASPASASSIERACQKPSSARAARRNSAAMRAKAT